MEIEFNADMDYVCLTDHKAKAQNKEKKPISHSLIGKTHPEKKVKQNIGSRSFTAVFSQVLN